jgi:hypothetical protein
MATTPRTSKVRQAALKHGYRSGLEDTVGNQLTTAGVTYKYEELVIEYTKPEKVHKYTPDFALRSGVIIETKGRFLTDDRQKHLLVKKQRPDLDIRFVFSNSKTKISKQSKTTYAMWCEKHGFLYADKQVPASWLN